MAAWTALCIPDILQEHCDELAFLWAQRQGAFRSPKYTLKSLAHVEARIAAHVDGLVIAGKDAVPILQPHLIADEPGLAFAAGFALLAMNDEEQSSLVVRALTDGEKAPGPGLVDALRHALPAAAKPALQQALAVPKPAVAAVAAEILAFQGFTAFAPDQIPKLLKSDSAPVRASAWRAVSQGVNLAPQHYKSGFMDPDRSVRREALYAAAWNRVPDLYEHCRQAALTPNATNLDAILLCALLAMPQDLNVVTLAGQTTALGPDRFRVLGAFGHPAVFDFIVIGTGNKDPLVAKAAGAAFTKVMGQPVESDRRVKLQAANAPSSDEFADEVTLPDADKAKTLWQQAKPRFAKATRICQGMDISQGATTEMVQAFDLESRWEALSGKWEGKGNWKPAQLERFPQA